jgi:hypothetical protein
LLYPLFFCSAVLTVLLYPLYCSTNCTAVTPYCCTAVLQHDVLRRRGITPEDEDSDDSEDWGAEGGSAGPGSSGGAGTAAAAAAQAAAVAAAGAPIPAKTVVEAILAWRVALSAEDKAREEVSGVACSWELEMLCGAGDVVGSWGCESKGVGNRVIWAAGGNVPCNTWCDTQGP